MSGDSGSGLRVYVWAMGALALVAGGGLLYHASAARQIEEQLPRDRRLATEAMAPLASAVESLASRRVDPEKQKQSKDRTEFQQFFENMAGQAAIDAASIAISRPDTQGGTARRVVDGKTIENAYAETRYTINIRRANRRQIAAFLFNVENWRPYLRTRRITLSRDEKSEEDWWKGEIVIAYRDPT